jgi:creatinine amidohydrolase
LSLRPLTLSSIVEDLLESAYEHGFRCILLLNGHGGNSAPIQVALADALHELHGLEVRVQSWWQAPGMAAIFDEAFPGLAVGHADASETSAVLAVRPDVVRLDRAAHSPDSPYPPYLSRQIFLDDFPHGVIGCDPNLASAEIGERILAAAVEAYEPILREWGRG